MLKISDISIEKLKNNQFQIELPEFFELKNYVENDSWHNNSVFNHTILVLGELEKLLENIDNKTNLHLNQKIDNYARKDLLFLEALFHDIGKGNTFKKIRGYTSCPKHEEKSAEKVKPILNRFDLSDREKDMVVRTIKYHGEIHALLNPKNNKIKYQYDKFKSNHYDIFRELILLGLADTLGSQLKDKNPNEFKFRMDFYNKIINRY